MATNSNTISTSYAGQPFSLIVDKINGSPLNAVPSVLALKRFDETFVRADEINELISNTDIDNVNTNNITTNKISLLNGNQECNIQTYTDSDGNEHLVITQGDVTVFHAITYPNSNVTHIKTITPEASDISDSIATTEWVHRSAPKSLPPGFILPYGGTDLPEGFLPCTGILVSRDSYADLFSVIGTSFGAGDGRTTFAVPNLTNRFVQGSNTPGIIKNAGLPNITGAIASFVANPHSGEGAFSTTHHDMNWGHNSSGGDLGWTTTYFSAQRSNSIYGNSTTVQPPAVTARWLIRY